MAITEYKAGEHHRGLIGFRVQVRVPAGHRRPKRDRDRFFLVSTHGYAKARELAELQHAQWRKDADEALATIALKPRADATAATIVKNLSVRIQLQTRKCGGIAPTIFFEARRCGEKAATVSFGIRKHGYFNAYKQAVEAYLRLHERDEKEFDDLIERIPDPQRTAKMLARQARQRGKALHWQTILEHMDVQPEKAGYRS